MLGLSGRCVCACVFAMFFFVLCGWFSLHRSCKYGAAHLHVLAAVRVSQRYQTMNDASVKLNVIVVSTFFFPSMSNTHSHSGQSHRIQVPILAILYLSNEDDDGGDDDDDDDVNKSCLHIRIPFSFILPTVRCQSNSSQIEYTRRLRVEKAKTDSKMCINRKDEITEGEGTEKKIIIKN